MVGKKTTRGTISIVAEDTEDTDACIRRGCVYNVEETAKRVKRLILKLQNKLSNVPGFRIENVYIGVGGQSLRSIDHSVVKNIPADAVVSEDDIRELDEQCHTYHPELLDILEIAPPVYYLDNKPTLHPQGIACNRIEARYKLIVGRPSVRKFIVTSLEFANIGLAGIIVSPLSLADAMLSRNEKELGCALINFGAGVTSVVIYRGGSLIHLSVIPLGSQLITKDLLTLKLSESEAERVKITYGSALLETSKDGPILLGTKNNGERQEIDRQDINVVVEARAKEIVENVYARVKEGIAPDLLEAGIVLAGKGSELNNLKSLVQNTFKLDTRYSTIQKDWLDGDDDIAGDPEFMTAISLLAKGTENCVTGISQPDEKEIEVEVESEPKSKPEPKPEPPVIVIDEKKKKKKNFFKTIMKELDLFEDERNRHNADSQNTHLFCDFGNDGSGACTCSASHSGCDENHLRAVAQHRTNFVFALYSRFFGFFRSVSGSQPLRNLSSQHYFYRDIGTSQCLTIRIAQYKRNVMYSFFIHVSYSVSAAATYTDYLDDFL
jgi:cell division protein FtsA